MHYCVQFSDSYRISFWKKMPLCSNQLQTPCFSWSVVWMGPVIDWFQTFETFIAFYLLSVSRVFVPLGTATQLPSLQNYRQGYSFSNISIHGGFKFCPLCIYYYSGLWSAALFRRKVCTFDFSWADQYSGSLGASKWSMRLTDTKLPGLFCPILQTARSCRKTHTVTEMNVSIAESNFRYHLLLFRRIL